MNFYRLGRITDIPKFTTGDGITKFGEVVDGKFMGINYSRAFVAFSDALSSVIPRFAFESAEKTLMTINREVPPHTDSGIQCAINVYLKTSNCLTQFYDIEGEPQTFQIENQTNGSILKPECLKPADSFVAEAGEVYLLNVKQPHAVKAQRPGPIDRQAICLQSRVATYEEVLTWLLQT